MIVPVASHYHSAVLALQPWAILTANVRMGNIMRSRIHSHGGQWRAISVSQLVGYVANDLSINMRFDCTMYASNN